MSDEEITFEMTLHVKGELWQTAIEGCTPAVNDFVNWMTGLGCPPEGVHGGLLAMAAACALEAGRVQEFRASLEAHREDFPAVLEPRPMQAARRVVGIVASCGKKSANPGTAHDLYQSLLFRLSRRYVETQCQEWIILSALHGVVQPDQVIASYDTTLPTRTSERADWARTCNASLRERFPDAYFIVLTGARYRDALKGLAHDVPMRGLRIGKQIQWLQRHLEEQAN